MKELKEKIIQNKKIVIPTVSILVLCLAGGIFAITQKNDKAMPIAEKKKVESLKEEKKDLAANMEKELEKADTKEEKEAIKKEYAAKIDKVENKIEQAQNEINKTENKIEQAQKPSKPAAKPNTNTTSKPSGEASKPSAKPDTKPDTKPDVKPDTSKPSKPSEETSKPAPKPEAKPEQKPSKPTKPEKVWVVDKEAWDEVVDDKSKPIYDWVDTWVVVLRDGSEKVFYDKKEMLNFYYGNPRLVSSWHTGPYEEVIVGYEKMTIHHPEEGHWEYK